MSDRHICPWCNREFFAVEASPTMTPNFNAVRVPVSTLRQLVVELVQHDIEDIGIEDLAISIRARIRKSPSE